MASSSSSHDRDHSSAGSSTSSTTSLSNNTDFDFSSTSRWETFYQERQHEEPVFEWHASVPLELLAGIDILPPCTKRILLIGCGNSNLPTALRRLRPECRLVLLDSSPTCMAALQERYRNDDDIDFVCGDALQLSSLLMDSNTNSFDVVLDKGLMDALLCGDAWDWTVLPLLQESSRVLRQETTTTTPGGRYVLVSYKLPSSTKDFLVHAGSQVGLSWEFDVEGSNDRVGISIARLQPASSQFFANKLP